jgi:hypothetical protein
MPAETVHDCGADRLISNLRNLLIWKRSGTVHFHVVESIGQTRLIHSIVKVLQRLEHPRPNCHFLILRISRPLFFKTITVLAISLTERCLSIIWLSMGLRPTGSA